MAYVLVGGDVFLTSTIIVKSDSQTERTYPKLN